MKKTIVGANVKKYISKSGLKQKFFAEKIGMTERQLSDIINGRKIIDSSMILTLCEALEVSPNELFGYDKTA